MLREFRNFAIRGNAIDLAVGVIIGAAFGKIIDSLVGDLVMPLISALFGGKLDFTNMYVVLGPVPPGVDTTYDALKKAGVPMFAYGNFVTILINFILLAFVIFILVRLISGWKAKLDAAPAPPTPSEALLTEIRDLLKSKSPDPLP
jgi:large conductance mechanosensitive channel